MVDRYGEGSVQVERMRGVIDQVEAFARGRGLELS